MCDLQVAIPLKKIPLLFLAVINFIYKLGEGGVLCSILFCDRMLTVLILYMPGAEKHSFWEFESAVTMPRTVESIL